MIKLVFSASASFWRTQSASRLCNAIKTIFVCTLAHVRNDPVFYYVNNIKHNLINPCKNVESSHYCKSVQEYLGRSYLLFYTATHGSLAN